MIHLPSSMKKLLYYMILALKGKARIRPQWTPVTYTHSNMREGMDLQSNCVIT